MPQLHAHKTSKKRGELREKTRQTVEIKLTNHKINNDSEDSKENGMSAKQRFSDYYLKAKKKTTYKSYKRGLELFIEWYGKDADTNLEERKQDILSNDFERR